MIKATDIGMSPFNTAKENTNAFIGWLGSGQKNTTFYLNPFLYNDVVYKGQYKMHSLAGLKLDFRYLSIMGAGVRSSQFIYEAQDDRPFMEHSLLFEVQYKDFAIYDKRETGIEPLLKFRGGNFYGNLFRNIYLRRSVANGLEVNGGQKNTFDNIEVREAKGYGIALIDCANTVLKEPWSEANETGSILVECVNTSGGGRFKQKGVRIETPYMENNPIGVHLKGTQGVEIQGGFNSGGPFVKISKGLRYSHYNVIEGNYRNWIEIDEGNHSNYIFNTHPMDSGIKDADGRTFINGSNPFEVDRKSPWTNVVLPSGLKFLSSGNIDQTKKEHRQSFTKRSLANGAEVYLRMRGDNANHTSMTFYDLDTREWYSFTENKWVPAITDDCRMQNKCTGKIQNLSYKISQEDADRKINIRITGIKSDVYFKKLILL